MAHLKISIILSLALTFQVGTQGQPDEFYCQALTVCCRPFSNSQLAAHTDCRQYYECADGEPIAFNCPSGLYFNADTGICDYALNVDCENREQSNDSGLNSTGDGDSDSVLNYNGLTVAVGLANTGLNVANKISSEVSDFAHSVKSEVSDMKDSVKNEVSGFADSVKNEVSDIKDSVKNEVSDIKESVNEGFQKGYNFWFGWM